MNDPTEVYVIERLDQLKVLADPLRLRVLDQLIRQPMTVSQLGEQFGETTNKVHYHVRELERIGLLRLVEKRERGGVLEKYYRAVAKDFTLAPSLLLTTSNSEILAPIRNGFGHIFQGIAESLARKVERPDRTEHVSLASETLWMTEAEFREAERQISAILAPFLTQHHIEGERTWIMHILAHTLAPSSEEHQEQATTE